jgi:hypothetical protein
MCCVVLCCVFKCLYGNQLHDFCNSHWSSLFVNQRVFEFNAINVGSYHLIAIAVIVLDHQLILIVIVPYTLNMCVIVK